MQSEKKLSEIDTTLLKIYLFHEQTNCSWLTQWSQYSDSELIQEFFEAITINILRSYYLPNEWKSDVVQEAFVYFGRLVQRDITLGFDSSKGSLKNWLKTLIYGCCRKAVRQFKDSMRQRGELDPHTPLNQNRIPIENEIDLLEQVNLLQSELRIPFFMHWNGKSVAEISVALELGERTVYRRIASATEELTKRLS